MELSVKGLLTTTAAIEAGTGIGLLAVPSVLAQWVLGATLDAPAAVTVARVAGAGLLALGVACWLASYDTRAAPGEEWSPEWCSTISAR